MLTLTLLAGLVLSAAPAAAAALEVNADGKVLVGEDVTVEMAVLEGKNASGLNDVLMRITGAPAREAGIEGKTLRYSTVHGGNGIDFQFTKDGAARNRMSSRSSWGDWQFFELFLGGKTYRVSLDKQKSKESKPLNLLNDYKTPPK